MPLDTITALRAYELPDEGDAAHADLIAHIDGAKTTLRVAMYGFTDPTLCDAIIRAHQRGVECRVVLDHSEASTPTEAALLHRLLLSFPAADVCITTSARHQIMHLKVWVVDAGVDVPDAQYPDVDAARLDDYPRVITGSTNASPTALRQANHLLIIPGKAFAAMCAAEVDTQFAWGRAQEPSYQPAGVSSSISTPSQSASSEPAA